MSFSKELPLPVGQVKECRQIAKKIGFQVLDLVDKFSTLGTERGVLRLLGFNEAIEQENLLYPVSNFMVDQLVGSNRIQEGVLYWVANAIIQKDVSLQKIQSLLVNQKLDLGTIPEFADKKEIKLKALEISKLAYQGLVQYRKKRKALQKSLKDPAYEKRPLKYVIVATGNIFEDVLQAESAVLDGADIIAVIRSTAQSLLDYVPQGTTTEGFGGTYATQANFRVMREALDKLGERLGKYIRLTNYCSGLCMSEIAALATLEGLDCLLNDAMYGILFRDINPIRTLIDQHFSRQICGSTNLWIMTGEDNYMKTTDAKESGDQVLASQFINEISALNAGMSPEQLCIGHAMEMDPSYKNVILYEIARAQMTRQIFKKSPLKYMCNTKYKTGDIFTSHAIDTVFNFIGGLTQQGMILLGMPTEAIHTPFLQDRTLSLRSANYILNGTLSLYDEIAYSTNGLIANFAKKTLGDCLTLLRRIEKQQLLKAIEKRTFAGVSRTIDGGKGKEGVFVMNKEKYLNPFAKWMGKNTHG